jgi:hypothetical protein
LKVADEFHLPWVREWGTTVTQTITVEDQTGLSPGISAITPFKNGLFGFPASNGGNVVIAQSFSFNLGGTASANALRTETIQYTLRNQDLLAWAPTDKTLSQLYEPYCNTKKGAMIDGDLKIREFIFDNAQVATADVADLYVAPGITHPRKSEKGRSKQVKYPPFNNFTEEITFVASYGASVTPTWHLARFSANTSANLLVGQRTNTNDLVITLGPIKCPKPPKPKSRNGGASEDPSAILSQLNKQECPKNGAPVALVDSAMNQHQARVAANAIATSITGQTH